MTVQSTTRKAGPFDGNGVTTEFPFDFKVFQATDIRVVLTDPDGIETDGVLDSNYSVSLNADQDADPGGTVTYPDVVGVVLPTGSKLTIVGAMPQNQLTDITNVGRFNPDVVERAFDKNTILIQQLQEQVGRAVLVQVSSDTNPQDLIAELIGSSAAAVAAAAAAAGSAGAAAGSAGTAAAAAADADAAADDSETSADAAAASAASAASAATTAATTVVNSFKADLALQTGAAATGALLSGFKHRTSVSSVGRTVQDKLEDWVNAADFGLKTTNTGAQNVAALQAAFTYAAAIGGACIRVNQGTYQMTGMVDTTGSNIALIGAGMNATVFQHTNATNPLFNSTAACVYRTFSDFTIQHTVTRTAGHESFRGFFERRGLLENIRLLGHADGFNLIGFEQVIMRNLIIVSPSQSGIGIIAGSASGSNSGANLLINDCFLRGCDDLSYGTNLVGTTGVEIRDIEAVWMANTDISAFVNHSVLINPTTRCANCYFTQSFFDATTSEATVKMQGAGLKIQLTFNGCWFASSGRLTPFNTSAHGLYAANAGTYADIQITGCRFYNNNGSGLFIEHPGADYTISGNTFNSNGLGLTASYRYGLQMACATTQTIGANITGNHFAASSISDLRFEATSRLNVVTGNYLPGGITCDSNLASTITYGGAGGNYDGASPSTMASASQIRVQPTVNFVTLTGAVTLDEIKFTYPGHLLHIYANNAFTIGNLTGNIDLATGVNYAIPAGKRITLINHGNSAWREVSRSV